MKGFKSVGLITAVLALVFAYAPSGAAGQGKKIENIEQMIAEAKTPADHEAVAAVYEREAHKAREQEARHLKMRKAYGRFGALKQKTGLVKHCQHIAGSYGKVAEEYEALAKLHRAMAAEAQ